MYLKLQGTTKVMVRNSKFCHAQNVEIRAQYCHITAFVHVISFLRKRSLLRTGHEVPEGE